MTKVVYFILPSGLTEVGLQKLGLKCKIQKCTSIR